MKIIKLMLIGFMFMLPTSVLAIDTDGDGIEDNIDIDDDNDGILDVIENMNQLCSDNVSGEAPLIGPSYFSSITLTQGGGTAWTAGSDNINQIINGNGTNAYQYTVRTSMSNNILTTPMIFSVTNKNNLSIGGMRLAQDYGIQGDGIREFKVRLYNSSDTLLGEETLIAPIEVGMYSLPFLSGKAYSNVAHWEFEIINSFPHVSC